VRIYGVAKTIVDCFRYRNKIGIEVALEALCGAIERRLCSVNEISKLANELRVLRVIQPYIEATTADGRSADIAKSRSLAVQHRSQDPVSRRLTFQPTAVARRMRGATAPQGFPRVLSQRFSPRFCLSSRLIRALVVDPVRVWGGQTGVVVLVGEAEACRDAP
jgi:hypothetical protein